MSFALVGARIIVGDGTEIDTGSVRVEDGRITAVEKGRSLSADRVADLGGRTLMPGMIDIHSHMVGGNKARGGWSPTGMKMTDPVIKAVLDSVEGAHITLNAGITTVREVGGRDYIDIFLRRAQSAGQILAPRILGCGPGLFMTGGHGAFLEPGHEADGVVEVVQRVRELVANNVDALKIFSTEGPETLGSWFTQQYTREELAAAIAEAHRLGRMVGVHAYSDAAINTCVALGADTIEHGWYLSEETCALMKERGTYLAPTLGVVVDANLYGQAYEIADHDIPGDEEEVVRDHMTMAFASGVKVALGSDCGGFGPRRLGRNADELVHYVECGMAPMRALMSATQESARALHLDAEVGTIEVGKAADLLVVDGDPIADINLVVTAVVGVLQAGRVIRDDLGILHQFGIRQPGGRAVPRVAGAKGGRVRETQGGA